MSMAAPDLEVIKDIPGYKVILKAVIKAQIQQLVEQLAAHTDEESVILTASVNDGTLSHLGSDSGKGFLEEQEDVKTQFLGFCLRRHHKKLQAEKEKEKEKERQRTLAQAPLPGQFDIGPGARRPRMPYQSGPHHSFSPQGFQIRSPSNRHEPYHVPKPGRRTSSETSFAETSQGPLSLTQGRVSTLDESIENFPMKTEPNDDDLNSDSINKDEDNTNSSVSTVTNDQSETRASDNAGTLDSDSVKVEAISESEFELEITGVEPGRPQMPQGDWSPNVSMGMNFDPSQGASGSPADMEAQQGYKTGKKEERDLSTSLELPPLAVGSTICTLQSSTYGGQISAPGSLDSAETSLSGDGNLLPALKYICHFCNKICTSNWKLKTHMRVHTGERPYKCNVCDREFNVKGNLKSHLLTHNK